MPVTNIELKNNLSKYLLSAVNENIFITRHGSTTAKLTNPFQDKLEIAKSLFGILPQTMNFEEAKEERVNEI